MGREINTDMKEHSVTAFWGGDERGLCVQITALSGRKGYIQLTVSDAKALCRALTNWIKE